MFLKSIRFQIVLWYMLILSLTLFIFSLVLYHNFSYKSKKDMDDLLRSRAKGITDSIDTYWETERLQVLENIPSRSFSKENNINFLKIAQRWVNDKTTDPVFIDFSVHIFDASGKPIASSKNMPALMLSEGMLKDIVQAKNRYDDLKMDLGSRKAEVFRIFTTPVIEHRRLAYIVQVASPVRGLRVALNNLSVLLFLLLPLTVIATGIAGAFLAKIALRPVHTMIKTIHQIRAENMKLRIDIPATKDEIHELAVTCNEMIARLDESFTSQRQFMENISHELKTPLSILKGELEITLKKVRSSTEYEDTLASSLEEVNRLVLIVDNLLTLARFDTKTVALSLSLINLNELLRLTLDDARVLAEQKNIAVFFHEQGGIFIKADVNQIRRLFLNLLDNAVKYTPTQGQITIDTYQDKDFVKVKVSDTGAGIPPEDLPFIFDRFYRVEKARGGGFGLGLSIATSIVEAHHGFIEVEAKLNQGSAFTVSFPAIVS